MRKKNHASAILASVFLLALLGATVFTIFSPRRAYSETEKRSLRALPALTAESLTTRVNDRKFSTNYESYVADQFFLRDAFVGIKNETELILGKKDLNGVYIGSDGYLFAKESDAPQNFYQNLSAVSDFFAALDQTDRVQNKALMLVSDSSEIYPERLPRFAKNYATASFYEAAQTRLGGNFLLPLDRLSAHKDEPVYYRTDHHWTTRGAYYGYQALSERFGFPAHPLSDYDKICVSESFFGTYAAKINLPGIVPDRIERYALKGEPVAVMANETESYPSIYFDDALQTSDQYNYFMGKNQAYLSINAPADGSGTLLVIKDSYAHSLVPFLTDHYDRILCVDLRYYEKSVLDLIEATGGPIDVLVLYQTQNFAKDASVFKLALTNQN